MARGCWRTRRVPSECGADTGAGDVSEHGHLLGDPFRTAEAAAIRYQMSMSCAPRLRRHSLRFVSSRPPTAARKKGDDYSNRGWQGIFPYPAVSCTSPSSAPRSFRSRPAKSPADCPISIFVLASL